MMNMENGPYMWMWFHTKIQDTVLFDTWNITDVGTLIWAAALIILTGVIVEAIKRLRWKIQTAKPMNPREPYVNRLFSTVHFAQTLLFLLQLVLSYCLMLIFMTFSVWLGLAVVIGLTIGYLAFGMMMMMYFHFRVGEPILFREWLPANLTAYIFSCVGAFLIAFALEILKYGRSKMEPVKKTTTPKTDVDCCCSNNDGSWDIPETRPLKLKNSGTSIAPFTIASITSKWHILSSILLFVQHFIDYSLMLVAMTYNVPIVLSVFAGHTVGYFFVGPLMTLEQSDNVGGCCS